MLLIFALLISIPLYNVNSYTLDGYTSEEIGTEIVTRNNCGADEICVPDLHVKVQTLDKYLLDSSQPLYLEVVVSNFGEDSFNTTFQLQYPEGIYFIRVETTPNKPRVVCANPLENGRIYCDIGNPLKGRRRIAFKIMLQPYHEEGMPLTYEFEAFVNNSNPGNEVRTKTNHKHISVQKWIDATLELEGLSIPLTLNYNESLYNKIKIEDEAHIGPQVVHTYYLINKGPGNIDEAEIILSWPSKTSRGHLLYLLDQPHTNGNINCQKVVANEEGYRNLFDELPEPLWKRLKIDSSRRKRQSQTIDYMEIRCTVGKLAKKEEIAIGLRSRLNVNVVNQIRYQQSEQPLKISSMMLVKIKKLQFLPVIDDKAGRIWKKEVFTEIIGRDE